MYELRQGRKIMLSYIPLFIFYISDKSRLMYIATKFHIRYIHIAYYRIYVYEKGGTDFLRPPHKRRTKYHITNMCLTSYNYLLYVLR